MRKIVIAIDGYAGTGKSTTAKNTAQRLEYIYIDTGAMYRSVTYYVLRENIPLEDDEAVKEALESIRIRFHHNPEKRKNDTYLNGENVEEEIRKMYISKHVSEVSRIARIRREMVRQQQELGIQKGIVMDGRDIGTQVFPEAELKIFMVADIETRARRRQLELAQKGEDVSLESILQNLQQRDRIDSTRAEGPLRRADDALVLDTTHLTVAQQCDWVLEQAQQVMLTS